MLSVRNLVPVITIALFVKSVHDFLPNDLSLRSNPSFTPTYNRCLNRKSRVANNALSEQNFSRTVTTDAELSYSDFFDNCDYYDQQALSELLCTQKESLFIMRFNVRSLPKNIDHLVSYLTELSESTDVIAVTETKLNNDTVDSNIQLTGYMNSCIVTA